MKKVISLFTFAILSVSMSGTISVSAADGLFGTYFERMMGPCASGYVLTGFDNSTNVANYASRTCKSLLEIFGGQYGGHIAPVGQALLGFNSDGTLKFGDVNWTRVGDNIYYTGANVGIGITTPRDSLHVYGDSTYASDWGGNFSIGKYDIMYDGGSDGRYGFLNTSGIASGGLQFYSSGVISPGTPILYVQNDGKVGIGTSDPIAQLDVSGSVNILTRQRTNPDAQLHIGSDNGHGGIVVTAKSGSRSFIDFTEQDGTSNDSTKPSSNLKANIYWEGNGDMLMINGFDAAKNTIINNLSGNVGIGTATPQAKLEVKGMNGILSLKSSFGSYLSPAPMTYMSIKDVNDIPYGFFGDTSQTGKRVGIVSYYGYDVYLTTLTGNTNNTQAGIFTLKGDTGNVGIGTTNPQSPLHIVFDNQPTGIGNDIIIDRMENNADSSPISFIRSRGTLNNPLPVHYGDGLGGIANLVRLNDNKVYNIGGLGSEYMGDGNTKLLRLHLVNSNGNITLHETGNVGIGTVNPTSRLDVAGYNTNQTTARITARDGFSVANGWPTGWAGGLQTWDILAMSAQFRGYVNIDAAVTASNYYYRSDKKLKKDILPLQDSLSKLAKIHGYSFIWKQDNSPSIGLIAQEVEQVFPELISEVQDQGQSYKTVQYGNLVAPLIEAVNTLNREKGEQSVRIQHLEEKNIELMQRIEALENTQSH